MSKQYVKIYPALSFPIGKAMKCIWDGVN